jgi:hypothetical protein
MLARVRGRLTYANVIASLALFLGCPGRDASTNPSIRSSTNRRRHFPTVSPDTPRRSATAVLVCPSAHDVLLRLGPPGASAEESEEWQAEVDARIAIVDAEP